MTTPPTIFPAAARALWLRQDAPIEALLPPSRPAAERGDAATVARAANSRTTGGYGYGMTEDGAAVFTIAGLLVPAEYAAWFYPEDITVYDLLTRDVAAAAADPAVKAGLFLINSPGGFVDGAYEMADVIAAFTAAKPSASFGKSVMASAAYLQASMTGSITAYKTAEVGSIGTRSAIYDFHRMFDRIGIEAIPLDSGGMKSAGLLGTEITAEQRDYFRGLVLKLNQFFVDAVAAGRGFTRERTQQLADGRVHLAADALALGLIDHVGDAAVAMKSLKSKTIKTLAPAKARAEANPPTAGVAGKEHPMPNFTLPDHTAPASIAALKSAFPDDPAFALDAAEQGLTMLEATAAYAVAEKKPDSKSKVGNSPVSDRALNVDIGDTLDEYEQAVEREMTRSKKPRHVAAAKVLSDDEELRARFREAKLALRDERITDRIRSATRR